MGESIKSDRMKYVQYASYVLYEGYEKDGKGYLKMYGEDSALTQVNNTYKTRFGGKWYSLNGRLLRVNIVNQDKNTTTYASPIKLNGKSGVLKFSYSQDSQKATILGFMRNKDKLSGRIANINADDNITIVYAIGDGNNQNYSFEEQESFLAGNLSLSISKVPDGEYLIIGTIIDVYGYNFTTNGIAIKVKDGNVSFEEVVKARSNGTDNVIYYEP